MYLFNLNLISRKKNYLGGLAPLDPDIPNLDGLNPLELGGGRSYLLPDGSYDLEPSRSR